MIDARADEIVPDNCAKPIRRVDGSHRSRQSPISYNPAMARKWRSLAVKCYGLLLLGAVVNIAVAWAFAACWNGQDSNIGATGRYGYILGGHSSMIFEVTSGLPCRTLQGNYESDEIVGDRIEGAWVIPIRFRLDFIVLPLKCLWTDFMVNTVFYAAVLWMVFAFPIALRRRRRIKRGLCPACAYPVGTSDLCTECGAAVTPRWGETLG